MFRFSYLFWFWHAFNWGTIFGCTINMWKWNMHLMLCVCGWKSKCISLFRQWHSLTYPRAKRLLVSWVTTPLHRCCHVFNDSWIDGTENGHHTFSFIFFFGYWIWMWHLIYALCYNGTLTNIDFIVNKYVRWQITKNVHMLLMRMHVRVRRTLCAVVGEYPERAIAESSYRWLPSEPVPAMIRLSYVLLVIVTQVLRYYQLL